MAFKCPNGVHETSTTAGTGDLTLEGAVTGRRAFSSQLSNGDTVPYGIDDGTDFEFGIGTYTSTSGQKLSRDVVLESSNGNAKVDWPVSGTRNVRVGLPGQLLASLVDEALGNGLMARTGARTYAPRTLQNGGGVAISNPGGVAGNPSFNIDPAFSNIWTALQSISKSTNYLLDLDADSTVTQHLLAFLRQGVLQYSVYLASTGQFGLYDHISAKTLLYIAQNAAQLSLTASGMTVGGQPVYAGAAAVLAALLTVDTDTSGLNANLLQGFNGAHYLHSDNHIGAKLIGWCDVDTAGTIVSQGGVLSFSSAVWSGSGAACTVSFTGNTYGTAYIAKADVQDSTGAAEGLDANVGSKGSTSVIVNTTVTSGGGLSRTKRAFGLAIFAGN